MKKTIIIILPLLCAALALSVWIGLRKEKPVPRLLDLGATECVPCKMMAPILEEMKKEYAGKLDVEFIDVSKDPDAGKKYGIESIPTQIFYDASGKEFFRHTGFYSKEDILEKFRTMGVDVGKGCASIAETTSSTTINPYTGKPCAVRIKSDKPNPIIEKSSDQPVPDHHFIVYFFCSGEQCGCSDTIEMGAYDALTEHFSKELKSGRLAWKKLDVAEEENAHFADDYELEPLDHLHNGLVLVEVNGKTRGRWKKLIEADDLKDMEEEYATYVKKELLTFMQEKKGEDG